MPPSGSAPSPAPEYLYKILIPADVPPDLIPFFSGQAASGAAPLKPDDALPKTSLDVGDGFIHLSTAFQVPFVLGKFYSPTTPGTEKVFLFKLDYVKLAEGEDVRWESAGPDGNVFAHVYGGEIRGKYLYGWKEVSRGKEGWEEVLRRLSDQQWSE